MLSALASLASGVISSAGQIWSNYQNIKQQRANNALAVELANTAHQREVADLKAAGLNPILSASGAGSEVPSLGVASQINPATGIADGMSSAASLFTPEKRATVENIKANTAKLEEETSAIGVNQALQSQQRRNAEIQGEILEAQARSADVNQISERLQKAAYNEALTGQPGDNIYGLFNWKDKEAVKTYKDLVTKYRNQIEKEKYLESVERQMLIDAAYSAESVGNLSLKGQLINRNHKINRRMK